MTIVTGFDLETSGLLAPEHRILECALILYDLESQTRLGSFVRRWNPGRPIEAKAQEVHKITFEQVAHLPRLEDDKEGQQLICRVLSKSDYIVAHNGIGFDAPFIDQEFARIGVALPRMRVIDTMLQGRWATPLGKPPNLGELCFAARVHYDPEQAHAAEYDVDRMMECFFHGYTRGFFNLPE
jgi:DNA polymerase-3 subunit epsilon